MADLSRKIAGARTPILTAVLLATVVAAYFARKVTVNTDLVAFLPKNNPHVRLFEEAGRTFGGNYLAIVGLEADDVFTVGVLTTVDQLTRAFQRIPGVSSVTSLANVIDFKETEWGVEVAKLLENGKIPTASQDLRHLKEYVLSRSLYRDKLVSHDARVTLIVARLRDDADRMEIAKQLRLQSKAIVGDRYRLYFAGLPFEMEFMGRLIFVDLLRLTPIAALLIVLILYLAFRTSRGVILPFTTVVVSTIWVLGFMGMMGIPLSLVSAATPVLILAVGSAYGIHMLKRYEEESRLSASSEQATVRALQTIGLPIALAAVTTLVGFLTLLSSQLVIIRHFGLVTGLGVVFALLVATTFVPAVLAHMPLPAKRRSPKRSESANWRWLAQALPNHVLAHPGRWVAAASVLSLVAILGIPRITREVNISEYFKPNSEVRVSEKMMEDRFGGSYPAQIVVHGDAKDPATLQLMRQIERRLSATPWLTNPESVADLICEMNRVMNDRYVVPDTRQGVGNLWFLLEGQDVMNQYVADGNTQAQIQLRIRSMDTGVILRSVNYIDHYLSTLPDTLVTVSMDSLPSEVQALADRYAVNAAVQAVKLELTRRGMSEPDTALLRQLFTQALQSRRTPAVSPRFAGPIARALVAFLRSDESDLPVSSPVVAQRLTQVFTRALVQGKLRSRRDVAALLKVAVPSARRADQGTLQGVAEQLWYTVRDRRKDLQTEAVLDTLWTRLPATLPRTTDLRRDLKAAVWVLNRDRLVVPNSTFRAWHSAAPVAACSRTSVRLVHAGLGPIFRELDAKLLRSQLVSLGLALAFVLILLAVQFRSLKFGLIGVSPLVLTLLVNFGVMGYTHIPLDDATLMIAPLAIGIGVDYAIHFTSRFRRELSQHANVADALLETYQTTGVAILINALSVGLGFLVLLFGDVVPVQRFGLLVALAMLVSAGAALTLLPALLLVSHMTSATPTDKPR